MDQIVTVTQLLVVTMVVSLTREIVWCLRDIAVARIDRKRAELDAQRSEIDLMQTQKTIEHCESHGDGR